MVEYLTTDTELTSIADAIRTKGGTSAPLAYPAEFISAIEAIQTGGGGAVEGSLNDDVIFYDDLANDGEGGIVATYTASEFANLTSMPANPDHSDYQDHGISIPMTSQGWNWDLSNAKAYVSKYGKLVIGQTYKPTDNKTHLICYAAPGVRTNWNYFECNDITGNSSVITEVDGVVVKSNGIPYLCSTVFSTVGWHDISFSGGTVTIVNNYGTNTASKPIATKQALRRIYIGTNITSLGQFAFADYYCVDRITIPTNVTSLGASTFRSCSAIKSMTIPLSITSLPDYVFYGNYSMRVLSLPKGITSIGSSSIYLTYSLVALSIPDSVTSIGTYGIGYCAVLSSIYLPDSVASIGNYGLIGCSFLHTITIGTGISSIGANIFNRCGLLSCINIKATTPPTLSNVNAFDTSNNGIDSGYKIYVPSGSLSAYQSASNWSNSSIKSHIEAAA